MKYMEKIRKTTMLSAIIYIIVGLVMIIFPAFVSNSICYVIGSLSLVFGLFRLMTYFQTNYKNFLTGIFLFSSLLFIGLGIYIILFPEKIISMIPFIIGMILIVDGIQKLVQVHNIKRAGYDNPLALLIYAVLLIILGIILLRNPFGAIVIVIRIVGIFLVVDALEEIITVRKYEKAFEDFKGSKQKGIKIIEEEPEE